MIWAPCPRWFLIGLTNTLRPIYPASVFQPKRHAGHSHWQNVRHTKEAKDKIKAANAQYYRFAVMTAIRAGGGIRDPKLNKYLADVLAQAKAHSVPFSTLERVINADDTTDPYVVELQALGGLFILVESCAKPVQPEIQRLRSLAKKYGCTAPSIAGKVMNEFFHHLGLVKIKGGPDTGVVDLDSATNLGIEISATEVEELEEDGQLVYQFQCDPINVTSLQQCLEQDHAIPVLTALDTYVPKTRVLVSQQAYKNLNEMYAKIRENHEHVERIFDNVTVAENT